MQYNSNTSTTNSINIREGHIENNETIRCEYPIAMSACQTDLNRFYIAADKAEEGWGRRSPRMLTVFWTGAY